MSNGTAETLKRPALATPRDSSKKRNGFPLGPIVAFVTVWLGGSWLVVGGWAGPLLPGGWAAVLAGLVIAVLPVWTLARGVQGLSYPSAVTRLLVLRPFWYAMLFMPMLAAVTLIGAFLGLPFGASGVAGRSALGIAVAVLVLAVVVGYLETRRLVVKSLEVRMPRLPTAFDGLRLVQISDLHVGPHTSRHFLRRVAEAVQDADPDLILVTGDQVDDFAQDIEHFNAAFGGLEAPFGTFVVAGNHDVYAGWDAVARGLSEAGFNVLVNEAAAVERDGQRLWIAGTGDPAAKGWPGEGEHGAAPDVVRTLAGIPAGEPVVALAHNPAFWPALASGGADLTLSGHTHYGQLAVPSRGWSMASPFLRLAMGSHRQGRSLLYINPGTNYWGIPFRIGTPPEVTVLTLKTGRDTNARISEV